MDVVCQRTRPVASAANWLGAKKSKCCVGREIYADAPFAPNRSKDFHLGERILRECFWSPWQWRKFSPFKPAGPRLLMSRPTQIHENQAAPEQLILKRVRSAWLLPRSGRCAIAWCFPLSDFGDRTALRGTLKARQRKVSPQLGYWLCGSVSLLNMPPLQRSASTPNISFEKESGESASNPF